MLELPCLETASDVDASLSHFLDLGASASSHGLMCVSAARRRRCMTHRRALRSETVYHVLRSLVPACIAADLGVMQHLGAGRIGPLAESGPIDKHDIDAVADFATALVLAALASAALTALGALTRADDEVECVHRARVRLRWN